MERPVIWVCDRCNTILNGNPRWCPVCGYTIYRPTFPDPEGTTPR